MGRLDRLLGLDDGRDFRQRASLWKRALWRGMKSLARHHPRAAIAATLSAIGYAGKQGVLEVIEGATKAGAPSDNASGELVSNYLLDEEQKKELLSTVG